MSRKCCVSNCQSPEGTTLHGFPQNAELFKAWCEAIGQPELFDTESEDTRRLYGVCDIHFDGHAKFSTILKYGSIPTLHLPVSEAPALDEIVPEAVSTEANQIKISIDLIVNESSTTQLILETDFEKSQKNVGQLPTDNGSKIANKICIKAVHRMPIDSGTSIPVCRICLSSISDGESIKISTEAASVVAILHEEQTRNIAVLDMLSLILPELQIGQNSKNVICQKCVLSLYHSYMFKTKWLETEKKLLEACLVRNNRNNNSTSQVIVDSVDTVDSEKSPDLLHNKEETSTTAATDVVMNEIKPEIGEQCRETCPEIHESGSIVASQDLCPDLRESDSIVASPDVSYVKDECLESEESLGIPDRLGESLEGSDVLVQELPQESSLGESLEESNTPDQELRQESSNSPSSNKASADTDEILRFLQDFVKLEPPTTIAPRKRPHTEEEARDERPADHKCDTRPCEVCGKNPKLASHNNAHKPPAHMRKFQCTICERFLSSSYGLTKHHRAVHLKSNDQEKPHQCDQCAQSFTSKSSLTKHQRAHSSGKFNPNRTTVQCQVCGKELRDGRNHKKHMMIYHETTGGTRCQVCNKAFWSRKNLIRHLEIVHDKERAVVQKTETEAETEESALQDENDAVGVVQKTETETGESV